MTERLNDDDLEQLERTDLGRRAAAEIRGHRATEPSAISITIGLVIAVVLGLAAVSMALRKPAPCPGTFEAPPTR